MNVAIFCLIGFKLKCDSGRQPGLMLHSGKLAGLTPHRCRMCQRARDGSDLACVFSDRVGAIRKTGYMQ